MSGLFVTLTPAEVRRAEPLRLIATAAEREEISRRFDLLALDRLEAELTLTADGEAVDAEGRFSADVTQRCVATGRPLSASVEAPITVRFLPLAALDAGGEGEVELSADDLDIVHYDGGRIAVGEMVAESLALALDPWPRSPDADAFLAERGVKSETEAGAFGALAALRGKLPKG